MFNTWFWRRSLGLLLSPVTEWDRAASEQIDGRSLFRRFAVPISLVPSLVFLPFIFTDRFQLGPAVGVMSCLFVFGINIGLIRVYAAIFQALALSLGGAVSEVSALKLSGYSLTPWLILLGCFPIIHEFSLLGLPWSFLLFMAGSRRLVDLPAGTRARFLVSAAVLCALLLFLSNLFLAGVLGMIVGPQVPAPVQ